MTDHDFNAEAREAAKRIPDPPKAPANVLRFPTPSERLQREARQWLDRYTVPMDDDPRPAA